MEDHINTCCRRITGKTEAMSPMDNWLVSQRMGQRGEPSALAKNNPFTFWSIPRNKILASRLCKACRPVKSVDASSHWLGLSVAEFATDFSLLYSGPRLLHEMSHVFTLGKWAKSCPGTFPAKPSLYRTGKLTRPIIDQPLDHRIRCIYTHSFTHRLTAWDMTLSPYHDSSCLNWIFKHVSRQKPLYPVDFLSDTQ